MTAEQKRALALFDNRTAELAEWNAEQLQADLDAGLDLAPWFTEDEQARVLGLSKPGFTDANAVPDLRSTSILVGDLFELGAHRLLCGDSTSGDDVVRLLGAVMPFSIVTDPPYGMDYQTLSGPAQAGMTKQQRRVVVPILGDGSAFNPMNAVKLVPCAEVFLWGGDWFYEFLPAGGSWVVWDKRASDAADAIPGSPFEVCWSMKRHARAFIRIPWGGWNNTEQGDSVRWHPTQKPVECMERLIREHGGRGDAVYDPFSGSGTTMLAAERQQRPCLAMEVMPAYVQMAIDRWEAYTGAKAVKVGEPVPA